MKTALELLRALQERWPAHNPRHHALTLDGDKLMIQLGLDLFYCFGIDPEDMGKSADRIVSEIEPMLTAAQEKEAALRSESCPPHEWNIETRRCHKCDASFDETTP